MLASSSRTPRQPHDYYAKSTEPSPRKKSSTTTTTTTASAAASGALAAHLKKRKLLVDDSEDFSIVTDDARKIQDFVAPQEPLLPDKEKLMDVKWVEALFEFLFASRTKGWYVPNTVVYTATRTIIYYTDSQGAVEKLSRRRGFQNEFIMNFIRGSAPRAPGELAAYFVSPVGEEADSKRLQIEYFDNNGVDSFVRLANKTNGGILQQFLEPAGDFNNLIRLWWTPHMFRMESRQSKKRFNDLRFSIAERGGTFDANEHDVTHVSLLATVQERFKRMNEKLIEACNSLLPTSHRFTMMVLYLKATEGATVHLLFCTAASTACSPQEALQRSSFHRPSSIENQVRVKGPITCPSCRQCVDNNITYEMEIGRLIAHFMKFGPEMNARKMMGMRSDGGEDDWGDMAPDLALMLAPAPAVGNISDRFHHPRHSSSHGTMTRKTISSSGGGGERRRGGNASLSSTSSSTIVGGGGGGGGGLNSKNSTLRSHSPSSPKTPGTTATTSIPFSTSRRSSRRSHHHQSSNTSPPPTPPLPPPNISSSIRAALFFDDDAPHSSSVVRDLSLLPWEAAVFQIVRKTLPTLRPEEFRRSRRSKAFQKLKVKLCEACIIAFTKQRDNSLRERDWKEVKVDSKVEEVAKVPHYVPSRWGGATSQMLQSSGTIKVNNNNNNNSRQQSPKKLGNNENSTKKGNRAEISAAFPSPSLPTTTTSLATASTSSSSPASAESMLTNALSSFLNLSPRKPSTSNGGSSLPSLFPRGGGGGGGGGGGDGGGGRGGAQTAR